MAVENNGGESEIQEVLSGDEVQERAKAAVVRFLVDDLDLGNYVESGDVEIIIPHCHIYPAFGGEISGGVSYEVHVLLGAANILVVECGTVDVSGFVDAMRLNKHVVSRDHVTGMELLRTRIRTAATLGTKPGVSAWNLPAQALRLVEFLRSISRRTS